MCVFLIGVKKRCPFAVSPFQPFLLLRVSASLHQNPLNRCYLNTTVSAEKRQVTDQSYYSSNILNIDRYKCLYLVLFLFDDKNCL